MLSSLTDDVRRFLGIARQFLAVDVPVKWLGWSYEISLVVLFDGSEAVKERFKFNNKHGKHLIQHYGYFYAPVVY